MKKSLAAVSAIAVALVALWQYQQHQERIEEEASSWSHRLSSLSYKDTTENDNNASAIGAAAVAAAVVIGRVLYRRWLGRHSGSADAPAASKCCNTLAEDLGALLRSGHSADVTLVVGDSQLKAHRAILVARSPVFAAMMAHNFQEARNGHIVISDTEPDVLAQLLVFLYTDEAQLDPLMAPEQLVAADKYHVPVLKEQCERVISQGLRVESAAACAVLAVRHSCLSLKESTARFISAHCAEVMATEGWAKAVRDHPDLVVEVSRLVAAASTLKPVKPRCGASTTAAGADVHPQERMAPRRKIVRRRRGCQEVLVTYSEGS